MYFTPDIILSFFIVVQDICSDKNVLFIAMFWDFRNKIAYIVLQIMDEFWGRALYENQSNNSYFSTSTSNIAVIHILLYFFQNMCFNYVHIYLQLYDINTGGSVAA